MLDGKIARKYGLVTDFGKLMDPLADKFMVIGALAVIVYRANTNTLRLFFTLVLLVVIFRELAVTSLRLVASTSAGAVVAANLLGKIKTVSQMVLILFLMIAGRMAPILFGSIPVILTIVDVIGWIITAWVVAITIWSGVDYFQKNFDVIRNAK